MTVKNKPILHCDHCDYSIEGALGLPVSWVRVNIYLEMLSDNKKFADRGLFEGERDLCPDCYSGFRKRLEGLPKCVS